MKFRDLLSLVNFWTVFGALLTAGALALLCYGSLWLTQPVREQPELAPAALTVIPAPTRTPLPPTLPPFAPQETPTPTPLPGSIHVGGYVQISGTGGDGLRLRSAPNLDGTPLFLGYESEVFEVREGPRDSDGFTWWFLVAPYDETRNGWAAARFLSVIPTP